METTSVWERKGESTLTATKYAGLIAFWTALGLAVSALAASWSATWQPSSTILWVCFLLGLVGTLIASKSDSPSTSLTGYMMVAISLGLTTGPFVAYYTAASVARVMTLTCVVVIGLGVAGALCPESLEDSRGWLFGGLLILLAGLLVLPFLSFLGLPIGRAMASWDWVGIALFSGYVVYDMNRAMRIPYTMVNSIDSAVQIYLDLFNLFIRLLALFGDDDD